MSCLLGCLALTTPRLVIILVAIFSQYLHDAYQSTLWTVLGFFFLPLTTLVYAWAWHIGNGQVHGLGLIAVIIAGLFDLGLLGSGSRSSKTVVRGYYKKRGR